MTEANGQPAKPVTVFKSYRAESQSDWGRDVPKGRHLSDDDVRLGALLRIADALKESGVLRIKFSQMPEFRRRKGVLQRLAFTRQFLQDFPLEGGLAVQVEHRLKPLARVPAATQHFEVSPLPGRRVGGCADVPLAGHYAGDGVDHSADGMFAEATE